MAPATARYSRAKMNGIGLLFNSFPQISSSTLLVGSIWQICYNLQNI